MFLWSLAASHATTLGTGVSWENPLKCCHLEGSWANSRLLMYSKKASQGDIYNTVCHRKLYKNECSSYKGVIWNMSLRGIVGTIGLVWPAETQRSHKLMQKIKSYCGLMYWIYREPEWLLLCGDFKTAHLMTLTFTLFETHTGTVAMIFWALRPRRRKWGASSLWCCERGRQ